MNYNQFANDLAKSYPYALRPDDEYLAKIKEECQKYKLTSDQWKAAKDNLVRNYTYFPSLKEIIDTVSMARRYDPSGKDSQTNYAMEYFYIGNYSNARKVRILPNGDLQKEELPDGAYNYHLALPDHLKSREDTMSMQQAIDEGVISEEFYQNIVNPSKLQPPRKKNDSRFTKIGKLIKNQNETEDEDWDI